MTRLLLVIALLLAPLAHAADDSRVSQLEREIRDVRRDLQGLSRQVDDLQRQQRSAGTTPGPRPSPGAAVSNTGLWLDASKWQAVRAGMSELEVLSALGPPTSMRTENGERVLLYAMEIGSSGFFGGSVRLRERIVVDVQKPSLQ